MKEFILQYYYIILSLTIFFFIVLIGFMKESKKGKPLQEVVAKKEEVTVNNVSISELED